MAGVGSLPFSRKGKALVKYLPLRVAFVMKNTGGIFKWLLFPYSQVREFFSPLTENKTHKSVGDP